MSLRKSLENLVQVIKGPQRSIEPNKEPPPENREPIPPASTQLTDLIKSATYFIASTKGINIDLSNLRSTTSYDFSNANQIGAFSIDEEGRGKIWLSRKALSDCLDFFESYILISQLDQKDRYQREMKVFEESIGNLLVEILYALAHELYHVHEWQVDPDSAKKTQAGSAEINKHNHGSYSAGEIPSETIKKYKQTPGEVQANKFAREFIENFKYALSRKPSELSIAERLFLNGQLPT